MAGILFANNRSGKGIHFRDIDNVVQSSSTFQGQVNSAVTEAVDESGHTPNEMDDVPETAPYLAVDEDRGISSCPTTINCQISLLCYERSRELEDDILSSLQKFIFEAGRANPGFEALFVIYTVLTLLMDAYESYAIAVSVSRVFYPSR